MKKLVLFLTAGSLVLLGVSASYAGTKALMDDLCTKCHKVDRPLSKKKNRSDWDATVSRMAGRSAAITEEYKNQIVDFLSKVRNVDAVVHTAADANNLTEMEQLHVPAITAPDSVKAMSQAKITAQIGAKPHPMTNDHYIYAVDIYVNNSWAGLVELSPGQGPKAEFMVFIPNAAAVEVVSHCTVDGDYSAKMEIKASAE